MSASPITSLPRPTGASPLHRHRLAGAERPAPPVRASADVISAPAQSAKTTLREAALVAALVARVPAADRSAAQTAIPAILDAAREAGTTDPNRVGYLLATAQTESDFGANMTETGHSKAWFNKTYGCQDGNRPGTDDGYAFRGRGYVQTTHAGRYAEMSRRLGLPDVAHGKAQREPALLAHPEELAQPELAARALVVGVLKNLFTHNTKAALDATIPTGRQPGDVDFYHARGIVNGIVKSEAQAVASHATTFAWVLDGYQHTVLSVRETK